MSPNSRRNPTIVRTRLVEFFGAERDLRHITPGDADAGLLFLREGYAGATINMSVNRAKQFFRAAVRRRLLHEIAHSHYLSGNGALSGRRVAGQEQQRGAARPGPRVSGPPRRALGR